MIVGHFLISLEAAQMMPIVINLLGIGRVLKEWWGLGDNRKTNTLVEKRKQKILFDSLAREREGMLCCAHFNRVKNEVE